MTKNLPAMQDAHPVIKRVSVPYDLLNTYHLTRLTIMVTVHGAGRGPQT